jgi:hypothetical protein
MNDQSLAMPMNPPFSSAPADNPEQPQAPHIALSADMAALK